jgi:glucose-6-phosphate isomerase
MPFENNLPVLLAVLGIWYNDFHGKSTFNAMGVTLTLPSGAKTHLILPYDQHLNIM